jgi:hypothetical protein
MVFVTLKTDKVETNHIHYRVYKLSLGHAVAQLVEALHYKPEGRGFDSR